MIEPIFGLNGSALEFMKCIGMNDEKFVCPMENSFTEVSSGLNPTLEQNPHLSFYQTDGDRESILWIAEQISSYLMLKEYCRKNLKALLVIAQ